MKENMLDVLFYLFDNYPEIDDAIAFQKDQLEHYLQSVGFQLHEITRAFRWLDKLAHDGDYPEKTQNADTYRIFAPEETRWINTECQGHLYFLEQAEILDMSTREQVIDQIISLEDPNFDLDKLKWVILMVMINRPEGENQDFLWIDTVATAGQVDEFYH